MLKQSGVSIFRKKIFGIAVIPPIALSPYLRLLYGNVTGKGIDVYDFTFRVSSLKLLFLRKKIQIVHVHWIEDYFRWPNPVVNPFVCGAYIFQFIFFKILGLKIMITLHNVVPHERLYPRLEHVIFAWTLHLSDGIIIHNNYPKRFAEEVYKINAKKLFVIPHGNYLNYYQDNTTSSEEAREKLGISLDKFVLLFFGNIRPYKGIDLLLRSFEEALKEKPQLFLLIAGECPDVRLRTELIRFQERFPENCQFKINHIPDNEVSTLVKVSDFGILPYHEITSSGAALLFMSYGLPIIASNLPAMREILENTASMYFDKDDEQSLRDVILAASRKAKLSDFDQKRILESAKRFDWSKIADSTISAYYRLFTRDR